MIIKPSAEFQSHFPDDIVEEDGEIVQYPGKAISEAIADHLRGAGYEVTAPEHQHERGWDFWVKAGRGKVWMQVSDIGETIILVTQMMGLIALTPWGVKHHAHGLSALNAALQADPRFEQVLWYFDRDLQSDVRGATEPVVA